jgi:hypothetical protein
MKSYFVLIIFKIFPILSKGPNLDKVWFSNYFDPSSFEAPWDFNSKSGSAFGNLEPSFLSFPHISFTKGMCMGSWHALDIS